MYKRFSPLLLLIGLTLSFNALASKGIYNFGREANPGGLGHFSIEIGDNRTVYLGSVNEILVYDGSNFEVIDARGFSTIYSIYYDGSKDRIYIGGINAFGYLERDENQNYQTVELSSRLKDRSDFKEIWQIFPDREDIYFVCKSGHFKYTKNEVTFTKALDNYFFEANGIKYRTADNGKLFQITDGKSKTLLDKNDSNYVVYSITEYDSSSNLIFYLKQGPYLHDIESGEFKVLNPNLERIIKKHWCYSSIKLNDDYYAFLSWEDGVFIFNKSGDSVKHVSSKQGLLSDYIYDLKIDEFGNIWLPHEYGLSLISMKELLPNEASFKEIPSRTVNLKSAQINGEKRNLELSNSEIINIREKDPNLILSYCVPGLLPFDSLFLEYRIADSDEDWNKIQGFNLELPSLNQGSFVVETRILGDDSTLIRTEVNNSIPFKYFLFNLYTYPIYLIFFAWIGYEWNRKRVRKKELKLLKTIRNKTQKVNEQKFELSKLNSHLSQVNEELDIFLYRSSHDLVAPIKSIKGLMQLLKMSKDESEKENYLNMMDGRLVHLENLLQEINNYVKIGKQESNNSEFNVHELIKDIWSEIEFMENAQKIEFKLICDKEIVISSQLDKWKMILRNLITNAVKYHDFSKENPYINIEVQRIENGLELSIADNGSGIGEEFQKHIFKMFYRATANNAGSGLGLFLVNKMVGQMEGAINLKSKPGEGSLFCLSFPKIKVLNSTKV